MKHTNTFVVATVLASSIGLAGIGISRAQTADTASTAVDTAVTATTSTSTAATTTTPVTGIGRHHGKDLAELATKFGMTATEVQTALESGTPMYQIAAEHGVTYAEEKASRLAEMKTQLDSMVKVGYMTQTEADAAYKEAQSSTLMGGLGFGGPHGRH